MKAVELLEHEGPVKLTELLQQANSDEGVHKDQHRGIVKRYVAFPAKTGLVVRGTEVTDMDRLNCKLGKGCCKRMNRKI